ncbi:MAG: hypothetical protein IJ794_02875 [Lachnospiraceae bacterium]|nr:hypothetical protein [Lachnospiraceae bacterium]
METLKKCLILIMGILPDEAADKMEQYALEHGLEVIETLLNDGRAVDKLRYYISREAISAVLVRSMKDIPLEDAKLEELVEYAMEHGVSFHEESRGYEPVALLWDGDRDNQMVVEPNDTMQDTGTKSRLRHYVTAFGEKVVDGKGRKVVECPTDSEAEEFIREEEDRANGED